MNELQRFLKELEERDKREIKYPDRMDRLFDVLGTILVKHRLGYGLTPQLTMDESIHILGVFSEGREAYKKLQPGWFDNKSGVK